MKYNFNKNTSRRNQETIKWSYADQNNIKDYAPLWIADMDFDVVPEVTNAIIKRAKHPTYGYTNVSEEVYKQTIAWLKRHHKVSVKKEEIVFSTGVVHTYSQIIDEFVKKDEKIIINAPIYPPFYGTPKTMQRKVVYCPMIETKDGKWKFDFEKFEELIKKDKKIKLFNLSNPYNPLGLTFSLKDLNKMLGICHKYGLYVSSDEIHADFAMPGHEVVSALRCKKEYQDKLIVSLSPTKTFNLAGLKVSYVVVPNKEVREKLSKGMHSRGVESINIFGLEALIAAYKNGDQWLKECISYMNENFNYVVTFLKEQLPKVKFNLPEATYLGLLDLRDIDLPKDFAKRLKEEAHVEFNPGENFLADYRMLRINVACPRKQLELGLKNLKKWLKTNKYI